MAGVLQGYTLNTVLFVILLVTCLTSVQQHFTVASVSVTVCMDYVQFFLLELAKQSYLVP